MILSIEIMTTLIPVESISYRRYHKINMQSFCKDLAYTSFVTSPASTAVDQYDQYIFSDLGGVLDRHAPLICRRAKKTPAGWLSDSYRRAKSIRHQFERMWPKDKSQLSRRRLRRQIAWCNAIINIDKAEYYSTIISDNSHDPKKLWHTLRHVLDKGQEMTLPPHQSAKSLANKFAPLFHQKSKGFMICSQPLRQQSFHPCGHLPTYLASMRSRRTRD